MSSFMIYTPRVILLGWSKSRGIGWAGHVACRKDGVLVGKPHEDPRIDGRIILKWILKKQYGRAWTGFIWRGLGNEWQAVVYTPANLLVPHGKCALSRTRVAYISIAVLTVIKSLPITVITSELSQGKPAVYFTTATLLLRSGVGQADWYSRRQCFWPLVMAFSAHFHVKCFVEVVWFFFTGHLDSLSRRIFSKLWPVSDLRSLGGQCPAPVYHKTHFNDTGS
jgi:hypothetical protein